MSSSMYTGLYQSKPSRDNRVYYLLDMCSAHNYGPNYSRGPVWANSAPDYLRRINSVPTKAPNVVVLGSNFLLPSDKKSQENSDFPPVRSSPRASSPYPLVQPPSCKGQKQRKVGRNAMIQKCHQLSQ